MISQVNYQKLLPTHRGIRSFADLKKEIESINLSFNEVRIKYGFIPMSIKIDNEVVLTENYYISPYGLIISRSPRSTEDYTILDYVTEKDFYNRRGFYTIGKFHMVTIHQLVALNFLPNPHNYKEVNHKDGDKTNNCVVNLEWCTSEQNREHAKLTKSHKIPLKDGVIIQYKMMNNGELKEIRRYNSLRDVPAYLPTGECVRGQKAYIRQCCYGCKRQYKGYVWKFANN